MRVTWVHVFDVVQIFARKLIDLIGVDEGLPTQAKILGASWAVTQSRLGLANLISPRIHKGNA